MIGSLHTAQLGGAWIAWFDGQSPAFWGYGATRRDAVRHAIWMERAFLDRMGDHVA